METAYMCLRAENEISSEEEGVWKAKEFQKKEECCGST
jgi:hypothetical protein